MKYFNCFIVHVYDQITFLDDKLIILLVQRCHCTIYIYVLNEFPMKTKHFEKKLFLLIRMALWMDLKGKNWRKYLHPI